MTSMVYKTLSRLGGRPKHKSGQKRPLPLIRDIHGCPVRTFEDQQRLWLQQFAQIEGGIRLSKDSLKQAMPNCLGIPADQVELSAVPTVAQLTQKVKKVKRGKAPGPDGILPDIVESGAAPLVHHF